MRSLIDIHDIITNKKYEFNEWKDVSCPAHCHYMFEAVIVFDGTFSIEKENEIYTLTKNQMMFIMPFEIHKFDTINSSRILVILISPQTIFGFENNLNNKIPKNPVCDISEKEIEFLLSHIPKVSSNETTELNCIFYNLLSCISQSSEFREYILPANTLRKMLMYVNSHFEESICLKDVAKEIGVNYVYLSRIYSKNISMRFNDFINIFRIQKSLKLLADEDLSVSDISYMCGFGSIRNFNRVFLKEMHCTPTQFRKSEQQYMEPTGTAINEI